MTDANQTPSPSKQAAQDDDSARKVQDTRPPEPQPLITDYASL
ncbi:hypothetical protein [Sulfitobacter aestuariivivens]|nr:hypothetical protein [Sulfitobacter aestuariivivens]